MKWNKLLPKSDSKLFKSLKSRFPKFHLTPNRKFQDVRLSDGLEEPAYRTTDEVMDEFSKIIGSPKRYQPNYNAESERQALVQHLPKSQEELPPRRMKDSYTVAHIPLGKDLQLRERFVNAQGAVRIGRILEELDYFSDFLCYKHLVNPRLPAGIPCAHSIVTGLVDDITIPVPLRYDKDIRMRGHVTWAGRTSMETSVVIEQEQNKDDWTGVMESIFVFVARDPLNKSPAIINKLAVETPLEKSIFQKGEANRLRRLTNSKEYSLLINPPTNEEQKIIHDVFKKTLDVSSQTIKTSGTTIDGIWMEDTVLKNAILCQPDNRNRFNKIYGGFLMRMGLELGWNVAAVYCKSRPRLIYIDDINFKRPVEIGSILNLKGLVVHTQGNYVQIRVRADVIDCITGQQSTTNTFNFTFDSCTQTPPPTVYPKTYAEAMSYLEGRRHLNNALSPT